MMDSMFGAEGRAWANILWLMQEAEKYGLSRLVNMSELGSYRSSFLKRFHTDRLAHGSQVPRDVCDYMVKSFNASWDVLLPKAPRLFEPDPVPKMHPHQQCQQQQH